MAAIVVPRQGNPLSAALMEIFAQSDMREAERRKLAQQASQFQQTYDLEKQSTAAQVAAAEAARRASGATADATNYGVASDRAGKIVAPIIANIEAMTKNGVPPDKISLYAQGEFSRLGDDNEVKARLIGYLQPREELPSDRTSANIARLHEDTTRRVADGGQNASDVNLTTKLGTGEQLSAPAFNNQDTREFGPKALERAVAISDDRTAGASSQLQASTQTTIAREGYASAERIANANREAAERAANVKLGGAGGGRAERNANLAADGVALIDDLLKHPGFGGAVGAKGPSSMFGYWDEPAGGTDAAGFAAKLERLRSLTTLPNLEMMRGLGAMSEKEMELVRASAGALSRNISEAEFRRELERMRPVLEKAAKAINFGASVGVPEAQGQTFDAPDGRKYRKVAGGWEEIQ